MVLITVGIVVVGGLIVWVLLPTIETSPTSVARCGTPCRR